MYWSGKFGNFGVIGNVWPTQTTFEKLFETSTFRKTLDSNAFDRLVTGLDEKDQNRDNMIPARFDRKGQLGRYTIEMGNQKRKSIKCKTRNKFLGSMV